MSDYHNIDKSLLYPSQYINDSDASSKRIYDDENNDFNSKEDEESRRNRRRSKNDTEGRSHKCKSCGKAYLSYPALYTHVKTKHDMNGVGSGKGRGRPKKDVGIPINSMKLLYSPASFEYFKHPEKTGETQDISSAALKTFDEVYNSLGNNGDNQCKIKQFNSYDVHPLYSRLIQFENNVNMPNENSRADEVFNYYLVKVASVANPESFSKVLKFVTLFRECLNIQYRDRVKASEAEEVNDYSEIFTCEDVPDISNEFITEYLCTEDSSMGFDREDAIDLTQNFCQWLYDNNYSSSKLSLISTY